MTEPGCGVPALDPRYVELLEAARGVMREWGWADRPLGSCGGQNRRLFDAVRAFDPPKPKRHTFGGVVFEETGVRDLKLDDWFLAEDGTWPIFCDDSWYVSEPIKRTILRPVAVAERP